MDNKESVTWHYRSVKLEIKAGDMHLPFSWKDLFPNACCPFDCQGFSTFKSTLKSMLKH